VPFFFAAAYFLYASLLLLATYVALCFVVGVFVDLRAFTTLHVWVLVSSFTAHTLSTKLSLNTLLFLTAFDAASAGLDFAFFQAL